jgi:hypothetical protein
MTFRVGVFEHAGKRKRRFTAYVRDYNPAWAGCCVHTIEADNGSVAKQRAISEHQYRCPVGLGRGR